MSGCVLEYLPLLLAGEVPSLSLYNIFPKKRKTKYCHLIKMTYVSHLARLVVRIRGGRPLSWRSHGARAKEARSA